MSKKKSIDTIINVFYNKGKKNHLYFFLGILIIIFLHLPLFILGEDSHIHISDNLFSDHLFIHLLKLGEHLFCLNPSHTIEYMLNGVRTGTVYSSFNFINIFYYFLPSFWAYTFNSITVKIIGFIGTYWITKEFSKVNNAFIILLISLFYSTIPVFVVYGISILGLPILFMAYYSLAKGERIYLCYFIILLFSFYSHFFLVGPFIIFTLFSIGFFHREKIERTYWIGFLILIILSLLVNFNFLFNYLTGEVSHRQEYGILKNFTLNESTLRSIFLFVFGHYNFSRIFILPILLLPIFNKRLKETYSLIILILILCFFAGFYGTLISYLGDEIKRPYDFSRFIIFTPLLVLFVIIKSIEGKTYMWTTIILLIAQIIINIGVDEDIRNNIINSKNANKISEIINSKLIKPLNNNIENFPLNQLSKFGFFGPDGKVSPLNIDRKYTSYKSFYCESLFDEIAKFIGKEKKSFRTINVGFPPAVNQYNGFFTLDGYHNFYPLSYKKKFSKIIEKEIKKDKSVLNYFQTRANACFLFSSELAKSCGFDCNKFNTLNTKISNLEMNTVAFKEMGGEYLMSSVEILNYKELDLKYLKSFQSVECDYIIYLYHAK